jgi:hypothetical protein
MSEHRAPDRQGPTPSRPVSTSTPTAPSKSSQASSKAALAKRAKEICPKHPDCCFRDLSIYELLLKEHRSYPWPPKQLEAIEQELFEKLDGRDCPRPPLKWMAMRKVRDLWLGRDD